MNHHNVNITVPPDWSAERDIAFFEEELGEPENDYFGDWLGETTTLAEIEDEVMRRRLRSRKPSTSRTRNNPATRQAFERRFKSRFVLVRSDPGDPFPDFSGYVFYFRPRHAVTVISSDGAIRADVPLDKVVPEPALNGTDWTHIAQLPHLPVL